VLLAVGIALVLFGLVAIDAVSLPFAGRGLGAGRRLGPVLAGATFSLVTTPCASPFLGAVLAAAAAQGAPGLSVASMLGFAIGYTALVFASGAFGGALVRRLRHRSFEAPRAMAGALLLVAGVGFAMAGIAWFGPPGFP
jgi:cytochrome c-type biogenesis protein